MFGNFLAAVGRIGYMLGSNVIDADDAAGRIARAAFGYTWPILTTLAGLGTLLAIWIGVRLATAQDESKRKEAKAQLIWAILAVVIIVAAIGIFAIFVPSEE